MGTKFQGSEEEILTLNTYISLLRSTDTITSRLSQFLSKNQLTLSQFGVLECLYFLGPLCQKELSQKILKSTANLTTVISNLEKRKFVVRVRQQKDKRFFLIHLTKTGHQTIEKILPHHFQEIFKIFEVLDLQDKKELYRICKKLGISNQVLK